MKKLWLVGALALGAASCAPEIAQDAAPDVVVAEFNPAGSPAVVPTPNDLAIDPATGLVNAPIDPNAPAAQQEFTRDYVNTLNGFPTTVAATTKIAELDKATVTTSSVRFIDLLKGTPIATPDVTPTIAYDEDTDQLVIAPPAAGWPKGGRYAVALIGGANGLKGTKGQPVVGSTVWQLASLEQPLVTCEDLTAPDCRASTDLIPSTKTDPAERIKDQTASALRLEQLRRAYRPLLDAVAAQGVNRSDIVLLWTFRIMNMPEATFNPDPAAPIIPFPNNLLLSRKTDGTTNLNLPTPPNASEAQKALIRGLNTLDGFSTTAPIVSENSDTRGPIDTGSRLDAASLAAGTKFVKLGTGGTTPNVTACLNCASSPGTTTQPQQLQFVPQLPLDEKTTYAAVMTTDLRDERGRKVAAPGAFALLRLSSPLVVDGKSQVSGIPDATANALEPVRAGFKPMFDALAAQGLPRSKISLAWAFTTQSTVSTLQKLHALPSTLYAAQGLPSAPIYLLDVTNQVKAQMGSLPQANIGKIFQGTALFPFVLTGEGGTLKTDGAQFQRASFLLALPATAAPAEGYPVTLFSHGLRSHKGTAVAIFNSLASAGHATIAMDTVFHGERSTCAGITAAAGLSDGSAPIDTPDKACNTGSTCDVTPTSLTYGRCMPTVATACNPSSPIGEATCATLGLGRCAPTSTTDATAGVCEGGFRTTGTGTPYISGWNMLNLTNLFATRDNFRHHTIEHAQLEAQGGAKINETQVHYVGQSLGGIVGPLYTSASPVVKNAVFNVPAGDLTGVLFNSPAFAAARTGFLQALAAQGLNPGTPGFDQFLVLGKTILDPADPINYIYAVENGPATPATGREALVQYIEKDQVAPNPQTEALIAAANNRAANAKKVATFKFAPTEAELPLDKRHSFLLDFSGNAQVTMDAQNQVKQFVSTGTLP